MRRFALIIVIVLIMLAVPVLARHSDAPAIESTIGLVDSVGSVKSHADSLGALFTDTQLASMMSPPGDVEGGARCFFGLASHSRSGFADPVRNSSNGSMFVCEVRYAVGLPHFTFLAGYSFNHSKKFSLYEYPRVDVEWIPGKRDHWIPILHASAVYARVKGFNDPHKFVKKDLGFESGIRIDGPFESFRYSYNTGVGKYHRADVIFAVGARTGHYKFGTAYTVSYGKYVRMVGLNVFVEQLGDDWPEDKRTRPFWHKALAWVAIVPFLPLAFAARG